MKAFGCLTTFSKSARDSGKGNRWRVWRRQKRSLAAKEGSRTRRGIAGLQRTGRGRLAKASASATMTSALPATAMDRPAKGGSRTPIRTNAFPSTATAARDKVRYAIPRKTDACRKIGAPTLRSRGGLRIPIRTDAWSAIGGRRERPPITADRNRAPVYGRRGFEFGSIRRAH